MDENNGFNGDNSQFNSENQGNQNPQNSNDAQNNQFNNGTQFGGNGQYNQDQQFNNGTQFNGNDQYNQNQQYNNGTQFNSNNNPNANQYNGYNNNQQYSAAPGVDDGKNWSIAALACGASGFLLSYIPYFGFAILVAEILGIVFGVKGRKLSTMAYGKPSPLATWGLVLGIIGTAWTAIIVIIGTACTCAACGLAAFA